VVVVVVVVVLGGRAGSGFISELDDCMDCV